MRPSASRVATRHLAGQKPHWKGMTPRWRGVRNLQWSPANEDEFSGEAPGGTENVLSALNSEGQWWVGRVLGDERFIVSHSPVDFDEGLMLTPAGWIREGRPTRGTYATLEEAKHAAARAMPVEYDKDGMPRLAR